MILTKRKTGESTTTECWTYYDELAELWRGPCPYAAQLAKLIQFDGTDSRKGDY